MLLEELDIQWGGAMNFDPYFTPEGEKIWNGTMDLNVKAKLSSFWRKQYPVTFLRI